MVPCFCGDIFDRPTRILQERVRAKEPRGYHQCSGRIDPGRLEISVQRAEVHARGCSEIVSVFEASRRSEELIDGPYYGDWQSGERPDQLLQHPIAECVDRDAFQQLEEPTGFIVEAAQDDVFDTGPSQSYDRLDGAGRQLRVQDDGQGGVATAKVFERFELDGARRRGVCDDDIRSLVRDDRL